MVRTGGGAMDDGGNARSEIDRLVLSLFAMVSDRLSTATRAFLSSDREVAARLIAGDGEFDTLEAEIEELVELKLSQPDPDVSFYVAVLRIVPELERSGDLVEHIALRTARGLATEITPAARELIAEMAAVGVDLWCQAADAYARRDITVAEQLRRRDDELDDLHVRLTAELARAPLSPAAAIELGLLARFYERLGDHAVNVARRVRQKQDADPQPALIA
jgi:phosphate transport system protein